MRTLLKFSFLALSLQLLTACPVKNRPRVEHEGRKEWSPTQTPVDPEVKTSGFIDYDLRAGYDALRDGKGDLINRVLKPLSQFVLNGNFIERAEYRTPRMGQMIEIFNSALLERMMAKDNSPELDQIKTNFYKTVFAGCSRDLKKDCYNAGLFSTDTRHSRIITLLARELDQPLETAIKASGTPKKCVDENRECRQLVEQRYRLLAMALYKRNRYDDPDFAFAYIKYARVFAQLMDYLKVQPATELGDMSTSYLAETHAKIFETIIPKYKPKDQKDPEFRQFVKNFNPWVHSNKRADVFQYGTRIMFNFAASCCLYEDDAKTQLSPEVRVAILEAQKDGDAFGPSFQQMIAEVKKDQDEKHQYQLYNNLGIGALISQIEAKDNRFYNEFFFVVDKLFRGDLSNEEVEMVLKNTNQQRLPKELPQMIEAYIKINLVYMVVKTNREMNKIYQSGIASDKVFRTAVDQSREITTLWHTMQSRIVLLDRMMGSYFKSRLLNIPRGEYKATEYLSADRLIKSINRNIHYLSVYPQMMVMNYFLAQMKGKIVFNSWWGQVDVNADTIIGEFFDGNLTNPWFRFGTDPEALNRQLLLFSFEYMLSTETLRYFKDPANPNGQEPGKFFDMVFGKYFDNELTQLQAELSDYEREIFAQENSADVTEVCKYELNESHTPPNLEMNFLDLNKYTYSGLGDESVRKALMKVLTGSGRVTNTIRGKVENRALYVKVLLQILENHLIKTGQIKQAGEDHPDTRRMRASLKNLTTMKQHLASLFLAKHDRFFKCALALDEIERRRTNRLYEEERNHLRKIYKMIEPLKLITDPAQLAAAAAELTKKLRDAGYRFDVIDGLSYKYSKYDLYKRIQKNIESDIFTMPTERERAEYGADLARLLKRRPIRINEPANVEREDIVSKAKSQTLIARSSEDDFVQQGMSTFNGKSDAFIDWSTMLSRDPQLDQYLPPLVEFYLIGPIEMPKTDEKQAHGPILQVTKEQLVDVFVKLMARNTLDGFDIQNAKEFGDQGIQKKSYFEGKLWERDFRTKLPFFYDLVRKVSGSAELLFDSGYKLNDSLEYARILGNLQPFVFAPSGSVVASAKKVYGERTHFLFNQTIDLIKYIEGLDKSKNSAADLDVRLDRPFFVENGYEYKWISNSFKNLKDDEKTKDVRNVREDFISRSGDFFGTRQEVQAP